MIISYRTTEKKGGKALLNPRRKKKQFHCRIRCAMFFFAINVINR